MGVFDLSQIVSPRDSAQHLGDGPMLTLGLLVPRLTFVCR